MLCASSGGDALLPYHEQWKSEGAVTRDITTDKCTHSERHSGAWLHDLKDSPQEKLLEQALNLDLSALSARQLRDIFTAVTDVSECKAEKYLFGANGDLINALQNYFENQHNKPESPKLPRTPSRQQRDSFSKECDHRCCMVHAEACCDCSDKRSELESYDIYIEGEGVCSTRYRWLFYCPVCKRRTQANSPPDSPSRSYAPLYSPKVRQRTCSKHAVCPPSCSKNKDSCTIC